MKTIFKKTIYPLIYIIFITFSLSCSTSDSNNHSVSSETNSSPSTISGQITVPNTALITARRTNNRQQSTTKTPLTDATVEMVHAITKKTIPGISTTTTDEKGDYSFDYDPEKVDLNELKNTIIRASKDVNISGAQEKLIVSTYVPEYDKTNLNVNIDEITSAKSTAVFTELFKHVGNLLEETSSIPENDLLNLENNLEDIYEVYNEINIEEHELPDLTIPIASQYDTIDKLENYKFYEYLDKLEKKHLIFQQMCNKNLIRLKKFKYNSNRNN